MVAYYKCLSCLPWKPFHYFSAECDNTHLCSAPNSTRPSSYPASVLEGPIVWSLYTQQRLLFLQRNHDSTANVSLTFCLQGWHTPSSGFHPWSPQSRDSLSAESVQSPCSWWTPYVAWSSVPATWSQWWWEWAARWWGLGWGMGVRGPLHTGIHHWFGQLTGLHLLKHVQKVCFRTVLRM